MKQKQQRYKSDATVGMEYLMNSSASAGTPKFNELVKNSQMDARSFLSYVGQKSKTPANAKVDEKEKSDERLNLLK